MYLQSRSLRKMEWVAEVSFLCLEITYSSLSSGGGGDVFLLLPRVLLEGGAFVDGLEPKAWVCL